MEFNNMRVKTILSHSSSIIHIGFFKDNDKEHFYSLSNNGQLKEWLLNIDGSILLLETRRFDIITRDHLPPSSRQ